MPGKSKYSERIFNCVPSSGTEHDWGFDSALSAGVLAAPPALPPSVDLRETWWQVGDQLNTGSCVGWATADSVLRWHLVKANKIGTGDLLSVRFIWMAAKETDEWPTPPTTFLEKVGTSLKAALDVARRYAVVSDTLLPFKSGKLYGDDPDTFFAIAAQLKIAMYINLRADFNRWRSWLATKGPILTPSMSTTTGCMWTRRETWMSIYPLHRIRLGAMRWHWWATLTIGSSSATVGAMIGAIRALAMLHWRMPRQPSPRLTG